MPMRIDAGESEAQNGVVWTSLNNDIQNKNQMVSDNEAFQRTPFPQVAFLCHF